MRDTLGRMKVTESWHDDDWHVLARAHVGGPDISVVSVQFFPYKPPAPSIREKAPIREPELEAA